jgi:hypothetical protein
MGTENDWPFGDCSRYDVSNINERKSAMRSYSIIAAVVTGFCTLVLPFARAEEEMLVSKWDDTVEARSAETPPSSEAPAAHLVSSIIMRPDNPNIVAFNNNVTFTFFYRTTEPDGVSFFFHPLTDGKLTPHYVAFGSGAPTGSGTATASFTVQSGKVTVNAVLIRMFRSGTSDVLYQTKRPVNLKFR